MENLLFLGVPILKHIRVIDIFITTITCNVVVVIIIMIIIIILMFNF